MLEVRKYKVPEDGTDDSMYGVYFDTSGNGWLAGDNGRIFTTKDNGKTWAEKKSGTKEPLGSIVCVDPRHCWMLGGEWLFGEVFLLRSKNGGESWKRIELEESRGSMVEFVDRKHGWIVEKNLIRRTTDGGDTWESSMIDAAADERGYSVNKKDAPHGVNFRTIKFLNDKVGWVAGSNRIARTDDGGKTWKIKEVDDYLKARIEGIVAHDEKSALAVNRGEWNYCTEDAGKTWSKCFRRKDTGTK